MSKGKKVPEDTNFNIDLGNLFKGLGGFVNLVNKMCEEAKSEITRTGEITGLDSDKGLRGIYGFTIRTCSGGTPQIESFGNIKKKENRVTVQEIREPIIDVFDENDSLVIVAELPGVKKEDIDLDITDNAIIISAYGPDRRYAKEVQLPYKIRPDKIKWSFNLGILEVKMAKFTGDNIIKLPGREGAT